MTLYACRLSVEHPSQGAPEDFLWRTALKKKNDPVQVRIEPTVTDSERWYASFICVTKIG